jgi:hypothetical protein
MTMEIVPLREIEFHVNVKGFLIPPNCYGCIQFSIVSFDTVTRIFDINVTLKNPTYLTGYDVRGILIANDTGHEMVNADDYTKLYDDNNPADINPFKAFDSDDYNRAFNSYETDTKQVLFRIPKPPNWAGFDYAVDASWPGHCKEPYEIVNFVQDGSIANLFDTATVSVDVHDWQDDVTEVSMDVTEIMGEVLELTNTTGDTWSGEVGNTELPAPGIYRCLVSAYSPNTPEWWLYDYVNIIVSPPNYDNRITFASDRTGNWDIFIMNPDGTEVEQLTVHTSDDEYPDFSPAERKIIFTSYRDADPGPPKVESELYIYDIDGEFVDKVSDECQALFADWSPNDTILFVSRFSSCIDTVTRHLSYFLLSGGDTESLVFGPMFFDYTETDFRYDEAKVLFIGHTVGNFVYEVDYPSWDNITQLTTNGSEQYCAYSPDGTKAAYSSERLQNVDIYVLDLISMEETRITYSSTLDTMPTWSPDGTQIAFTHYNDEYGASTDIYVASVDGTFTFDLTKDPDHADTTPCWSGSIF